MAAPRFKDALGREWSPRVTVMTLRRFEEQTGASLFDKSTLSSIVQGASIVKICTLGFLSCADQAAKQNVSFDDFCEALETDVQFTEMATAMTEALVLFFQSRQKSSETTTAKPGIGAGKTSTK